MTKKQDTFKKLTKKQGMTLLKLARHTIMKRLGKKISKTGAKSLDTELSHKVFQTQRGTFVTLHIDGQLRGCIGNYTGDETILSGVKRNALNAAFHDPRFPSLTTSELKQIDIEVSILTKQEQIEYKDRDDLIAQLRPNIDGVIIRKRSARAVFLPQVWSQLSDPEEFLSHLCVKAGLLHDAWQTSRLDFFTFQVQCFEEDK